MTIREDAEKIIRDAIECAKPDAAVKKALSQMDLPDENIYMVSIGKAAWQMAKVASELLQERISKGIVITKYDHAKGALHNIQIHEAGHPVPDENSFQATKKAIELVNNLREKDVVLFLISGGGSALFEQPLIPSKEMESVTEQLLGCGADIVEINTIRKRLSAVKGGKFAKICEPAQVRAIILSDIIGDPLDMIASGPAYKDTSTCEEANAILEKYHISVSEEAKSYINIETPKRIENVESYVTGSVKQLCSAAEKTAQQLGYHTQVLSDCVNGEAKEVGALLASIAQTHKESTQSLAYILGGETVVKLTGTGKGGRNQELALSGGKGIAGLENVAIFSIGSDGTDGPTDAAGGYCDGETVQKLNGKNVDIQEVLKDNNSYYALSECEGLIITGATGTNVNDLSVLLIKR